MQRIQTRWPAWRLAACAAAMLAANVQASPGPVGTHDAMLSSNPYILAPVQSGPLSSLGATPARNVYLPSGLVLDVHGRELAMTRFTNPEPMTGLASARPGFVTAPEADSRHSANSGVSEPGGVRPLPLPEPAIVVDVPEPSSFALMGAGLASLVWAARRRAQRRR